MVRVVRYAYAHIPGEISLCDEHADHPPADLPALGPVQYGRHSRTCAVCEADDRAVDAIMIHARAVETDDRDGCPIHGTETECDHSRMAHPCGSDAGRCEECGARCTCDL